VPANSRSRTADDSISTAIATGIYEPARVDHFNVP
jgi:hypothetical protein